MPADNHRLVFFHNPHSRAAGLRMLLEELGADFELKPLDLQAGDSRKPDYLAVNPMGKVPALLHGDVLVTEQAATYLYAAELYPEAGLSPEVGDTLRGPYLRWMVFHGSSFEPALMDRALKRESPASTCGWGDFDTMFNTLDKQLAHGPWLLGERFTAADVLWGAALGWTTQWKLVPETPNVQRFLERFHARPAIQRAKAADAALAKAMGLGG